MPAAVSRGRSFARAASSTNPTATATATRRSTCAVASTSATRWCCRAMRCAPSRSTNSTAAIFGGNEAENVQQVLGGKLHWTPSDRIELTAQVGRNDDNSENFYDDHSGAPASASATSTPIARPLPRRRDFAIAKGQLLSAGADWQQDVVDSDTAFDVTSRDNTGAFVEYQGKFGAHQLQASVRNDDNEQFGQPHHRQRRLGHGVRRGLPPHRELRHRLQGADLQRPVLPVLRQARPAAGRIEGLQRRHRAVRAGTAAGRSTPTRPASTT